LERKPKLPVPFVAPFCSHNLFNLPPKAGNFSSHPPPHLFSHLPGWKERKETPDSPQQQRELQEAQSQQYKPEPTPTKKAINEAGRTNQGLVGTSSEYSVKDRDPLAGARLRS